MLFIWRGFGLIVPIFFFICGWIVSLFYDDTRLGNPSFIGWTCFYAGITLLLPGLAMFGSKSEDGTPAKKHDFFFIPVLFWGLLLAILSAVILFTRTSEDTSSIPVVAEDIPQEVVLLKRTVNFLNSTDGTVSCVIANEDGLVEKVRIDPHTWEERELFEGSYLFAGFDMKNEPLLALPDPKYATDKSKYVKLKDEKGEFYQRILSAPTESEKDYDDAWIVVDGKRDLIAIDVTQLCLKKFTAAEVSAVSWTSNVDSLYDGKDMIEPVLRPNSNGGTVTVLEPGDVLPDNIGRKERVFLLMSVPMGEKITDKYIASRIVAVFYDE